MKYRSIKKIAKKFLSDKKTVFGTYKEECVTHTDGRPGIDQVWAKMPGKIMREIYYQAKRLGWDGCHWNNPLIISQDSSRLEAWEKGEY